MTKRNQRGGRGRGNMRERAKSESKGMKTTGGREGGEEKEGERESLRNCAAV